MTSAWEGYLMYSKVLKYMYDGKEHSARDISMYTGIRRTILFGMLQNLIKNKYIHISNMEIVGPRKFSISRLFKIGASNNVNV